MNTDTPHQERDETLLCKEETRAHAKSFYFASHVLPREKRDAAYAVYAFCRMVDNLVDDAPGGDADGVRARLNDLRGVVQRLYNGTASDLAPQFRALAKAVRRYNIPQRYFLELIDGVEMDLSVIRMPDFHALDVYCYHVASVVGLIMAHIFGATDPAALRHAAALGTAMQLTNILRDVREDLGLGRVYLPQDEMARFGIDEDTLRASRVTPAFTRFMQFQIARARDYYRLAERGHAALPDDGSRYCVRLMGNIYEGILGDIETRAYDVFSRRAYVSTRRKLGIAVWTYIRRAPRLRRGAGESGMLTMLPTPDPAFGGATDSHPVMQSAYDLRHHDIHASRREDIGA